MTNHTANPRIELVTLLGGLAGHYGKKYCYPSQDKICELYTKRTGWAMSRATLNRHLGGLVRDGWLTRTRRHRHEKGRGLVMHSTLYTFRRRALRWLASVATGLAGWAVVAAQSQQDLPCLTPSTISVPTVQNHSPGCASHPPGEPRKVALEYLQRAKELLRR